MTAATGTMDGIGDRPTETRQPAVDGIKAAFCAQRMEQRRARTMGRLLTLVERKIVNGSYF